MLVNRAIGMTNILACIEKSKAKVVVGPWLTRILMALYSNAFKDCKLFIQSNSLDYKHKENEVSIFLHGKFISLEYYI